MNHHKTQACKKCISFRVISLFVVMRTAVNFNNYAAIQAIEINNIVSDNLLAVKIVSLEKPLMNPLP